MKGAQWLSGRVETEGPRFPASPASLRFGPWARHIYHSLVLVQPRKTVPRNWKIVEWNQIKQTNTLNDTFNGRFNLFQNLFCLFYRYLDNNLSEMEFISLY